MLAIGHNGGPPLEEPDFGSPKLRWVKLNIAEALEGIEGLTMEERGFCLTGWLKMYARMGGFPTDDRMGAGIMGCDVRLYRRLKARLLGVGKFYEQDGLLKNKRVEFEIAEFCREHKRRRSAALEREQRRRSQQYVPVQTSSLKEIPDNAARNVNQINACSATTVPIDYQSRAVTRIQNQELEPERTTTVEHGAHAGGGADLENLNGAAVQLIRFIGKHAMVDQAVARNMLSTNIKTFGSQPMLEAFSLVVAEMAEGMVGKPYKYLIETARKIRDGAHRKSAQPRGADTTSGDRIARFVEEAAEKTKRERTV